MNDQIFTNSSLLFLSSLKKLTKSVTNSKLLQVFMFLLSWRNIFVMGQLNNLVLCYRGNVHSHKKLSRCFLVLSTWYWKFVKFKKLGLMWLNTEETLQATTTFIYHKNKDTRIEIISCKLEIISLCLSLFVSLLPLSSLSLFLSCMLCLMSEVGVDHCVIMNKSLRTSLN